MEILAKDVVGGSGTVVSFASVAVVSVADF